MSKEQIAFWLAGEIKSSTGGGSAIVGQIVSFVGATAPSKWLFCDGSLWLIGSMPDLYAMIGTAYGGDGITNFAVPDLRKRSPLGAYDDISLNSKGGEGSILVQQDNLPSVSVNVGGTITEAYTGITATSTDAGHTHTVYALPSRSYDGSDTSSQWIANMETEITSSVGNAVITTEISDPSHTHGFTGKTDVFGSSMPLTIQPPYTAVNFIVYTGVSDPVPNPPKPPPIEEPPVEPPVEVVDPPYEPPVEPPVEEAIPVEEEPPVEVPIVEEP